MTLRGNAAQFRSRGIEVEFQHRIAKIVQTTHIHGSAKRSGNLINRGHRHNNTVRSVHSFQHMAFSPAGAIVVPLNSMG